MSSYATLDSIRNDSSRLNHMEIDLIIDVFKLTMEDLKIGSPNIKVPPDLLRVWTNHFQSVIYKLEKAKE